MDQERETSTAREPRTWINVDGKLCLSGYPLRIRMESGSMPFVLEQEGRPDQRAPSLDLLKALAEQRAGELDEFFALQISNTAFSVRNGSWVMEPLPEEE